MELDVHLRRARFDDGDEIRKEEATLSGVDDGRTGAFSAIVER